MSLKGSKAINAKIAKILPSLMVVVPMDCDERNAGFKQPAGQEQALAESCGAVAIPQNGSFGFELKGSIQPALLRLSLSGFLVLLKSAHGPIAGSRESSGFQLLQKFATVLKSPLRDGLRQMETVHLEVLSRVGLKEKWVFLSKLSSAIRAITPILE